MGKKASDNIKYFVNPDGPVIGTVSRAIIERDGLYFKDLDGSGEFKPFDDWRMGKYLSQFPDHKPRLDESGVLDDAEFIGKNHIR